MVIKNPAPYKAMQRPYTRKSKVRSKNYIRSVPPSAVVKFVMGNAAKFYAGGFPYTVNLISKENVQIRDVALEAIRTQFTRNFDKEFGNDFYMEITVYPHHILREHKQAAVAQADRMSQGMSLSFGKAVGKAAQVKIGKSVFVFGFSGEDHVNKFRKILKKVKPRFCMKIGLEVIKRE